MCLGQIHPFRPNDAPRWSYPQSPTLTVGIFIKSGEGNGGDTWWDSGVIQKVRHVFSPGRIKPSLCSTMPHFPLLAWNAPANPNPNKPYPSPLKNRSTSAASPTRLSGRRSTTGARRCVLSLHSTCSSYVCTYAYVQGMLFSLA